MFGRGNTKRLHVKPLSIASPSSFRLAISRTGQRYRDTLESRKRDELLGMASRGACLRRGPGPARLGERHAHQNNTSANGTRPSWWPVSGRLQRAGCTAPGTIVYPVPGPYGASSLIRDASGEGDLGPKGQRVHVDAADHIPMPFKGTPGIAAAPMAPLDFCFQPHTGDFLLVPRSRTSEALDAGCFRFVREVGDVLPVFPRGHALIVMAPAVLLAYAIGVADEEASHAPAPGRR